MPTVEQALETIRRRLREASASGATVLKFIRGYGSTGRGGKISDAVRRDLGRMLSRFKGLKVSKRSDSLNHGVSLVGL